MYRAIRSYLRARARLMNAEAEKLSPSISTMLIPVVAGMIHGYFQPTQAAAAATYTRHSPEGKGPAQCPVCKAPLLLDDTHQHSAEAAKLWAEAPNWMRPADKGELAAARALLRRALSRFVITPDAAQLDAQIRTFLGEA